MEVLRNSKGRNVQRRPTWERMWSMVARRIPARTGIHVIWSQCLAWHLQLRDLFNDCGIEGATMGPVGWHGVDWQRTIQLRICVT